MEFCHFEGRRDSRFPPVAFWNLLKLNEKFGKGNKPSSGQTVDRSWLCVVFLDSAGSKLYEKLYYKPHLFGQFFCVFSIYLPTKNAPKCWKIKVLFSQQNLFWCMRGSLNMECCHFEGRHGSRFPRVAFWNLLKLNEKFGKWNKPSSGQTVDRS